MDKILKLTNGDLIVKSYQANIEACFDGKWVNHSFDGDIEYTTDENLDAFIEDDLSRIIRLNAQDIEHVKEELRNTFYMHSSEVFEVKNENK